MTKPTKTKTVTETPVVASVSAVASASAAVASIASPPMKEVKEKKIREKKVKDVVAEATVELEDAEAPLADQSVEFLAKLQQLGGLISSLKTEYRTLEKKWSRELKASQKQCVKRKRKSGNRAPSGFVKPTLISDELAKFLEKPTGSEMARTEVTRDINKYIRTNNLQDKDNGRKINPDKKLAALLKLKTTDELTYFNLQRYMSPHFAKANKDAVKEATA
jgi:chromatin remodeling complex protein RSC6